MSNLTASNLFDHILVSVKGGGDVDVPALTDRVLADVSGSPDRDKLEATLIEAALDGWIGEDELPERDLWLRKGVTELIYSAMEYH